MFVLVKPFRLSPCPTPFPLPHTRVEFCLGQTTTSWSVLMTYLSGIFKVPSGFALKPLAWPLPLPLAPMVVSKRLFQALGLAFAFAFGFDPGLKAFL